MLLSEFQLEPGVTIQQPQVLKDLPLHLRGEGASQQLCVRVKMLGRRYQSW